MNKHSGFPLSLSKWHRTHQKNDNIVPRHLSVFVQVVGYLVTIGIALSQLPGDLPKDASYEVMAQALTAKFDAVISFFIGIMVTQMFSVAASQAEQSSVMNYVERMSTHIDSQINSVVDCLYMGRGSTARDLILSEAEKAERVLDTFIVHKIHEHEAFFAFHGPEGIKKIRGTIENVVKRGGKWTSIMSERYSAQGSDSFYAFAKTLKNESAANFNCFIVKTEYPVINFTILEYGSVANVIKKRVYFGWGHYPSDPDGHVFSSENGIVIDMFEKYWTELQSDAANIADFDRAIQASDIEGDWCGLALIQSDCETEKYTVRDLGLVNITFDGRRIFVSGDLYDARGNDNGYFRGTSARLSQNRLYFSYERVGAGEVPLTKTEREGKSIPVIFTTAVSSMSAAHYDFSNQGDEYEGLIYEEVSGKRIRLIGTRVKIKEQFSKREAGKFVSDEGKKIIQRLKDKGLLLVDDSITVTSDIKQETETRPENEPKPDHRPV